MKRFALLLILFSLALSGVEAQKKGLLEPVTVSDLTSLRGLGDNGDWFLRLNGTVDFLSVNMTFDDVGKFTGFTTQNEVKTGFALSYAHYTAVGDQAVNDYSINAMLLMPVGAEKTFISPALSVSAFNFDVGIGYNIIGGQKFRENLFGMIGVHLNFGDLSP